jgi:hypothetical protein
MPTVIGLPMKISDIELKNSKEVGQAPIESEVAAAAEQETIAETQSEGITPQGKVMLYERLEEFPFLAQINKELQELNMDYGESPLLVNMALNGLHLKINNLERQIVCFLAPNYNHSKNNRIFISNMDGVYMSIALYK